MADLRPRTDVDRKFNKGEGRSVATFIELCHHFDPEEGSSERKSSMDKLFRTIKGEIIPRLMLVYNDSASRVDTDPVAIGAEEVEIFASLVLNDTIYEATAFVDELLESGLAIEAVFAKLLTPTARRLGELWEEDICSFTDVTIGLCRLHELLRIHSIRGTQHTGMANGSGRRALFATVDGDQHVLGVLMVAEIFRRDGWRVWTEPGINSPNLVDLVRNRPFDLLGLSAACGAEPAPIAAQIRALRTESMVPDLKILVGGALFLEQPKLVQAVGADGFAEDADSAVQLANHFITAQKHAK